MNISCNDRERIFLDGTAEEWAALELHAVSCVRCREELDGWMSLAAGASEMHEEWDSPGLWRRIERALAEQSATAKASWWKRLAGNWNLASLQWQNAAAALLLVLVSGSAIWVMMGPKPPISPHQSLLNDPTLRAVEKAQAAYEQAIDKLDAEARPQLDQAATPLMASYREKLQVLDSAIADLKSQAGVNPANGHVRQQLLAMYREKQATLEEILEAKQQ